MKSTWSTGSVSHTQASLSNEMWKIPVGGRSSGTVPRPPPGLTNNKHNNNWTPGPLSNSWSRDYASGLQSLLFLSSCPFLSFPSLHFFSIFLPFFLSHLCFSCFLHVMFPFLIFLVPFLLLSSLLFLSYFPALFFPFHLVFSFIFLSLSSLYVHSPPVPYILASF